MLASSKGRTAMCSSGGSGGPPLSVEHPLTTSALAPKRPMMACVVFICLPSLGTRFGANELLAAVGY
jgi:hypothetical protein